MTDLLQPMDQLVNKKIKTELRKEFDAFYSFSRIGLVEVIVLKILNLLIDGLC